MAAYVGGVIRTSEHITAVAFQSEGEDLMVRSRGAGDVWPSALSRWQALPQRAPTCSCFERVRESNVKIASSPCCYFDTNPPEPRPVTAEKD